MLALCYFSHSRLCYDLEELIVPSRSDPSCWVFGHWGPVVSLIISVGMANIARNTTKSFVAATISVVYCVGDMVDPQL
ncbi:hypothetical protein BJ878DRAFT_501395 [Calycina marina]|uniref:Uncharacterized protein n=1 Tax=Calycina marina TaxID=1763456 RepID=A0A9P8CG89_9HELO|nr:hypothetical protein BJ878DRAFT_501395 [Calycina marina]